MIPVEAQVTTLEKWLDALDVHRSTMDGGRPLCLSERVTLRCGEAVRRAQECAERQVIMEWYACLDETIKTIKHLQAFLTLPAPDHDDLDMAIIFLEAIMDRKPWLHPELNNPQERTNKGIAS